MITILIKIFIKIKDNLEAKILLKGNLEGGGGRLQREQERALHLQLGGTSQVTFQFWEFWPIWEYLPLGGTYRVTFLEHLSSLSLDRSFKEPLGQIFRDVTDVVSGRARLGALGELR